MMISALSDRWRRSNTRRGITLLELILVLVIAGILFWIALPTLRPNQQEALVVFAKESLVYLHEKEQAYFRLHGKFVPFSQLAEDEHIGREYDPRFAVDRPEIDGVRFVGPAQESFTYEIVAILPDDTRYRVDQSGEVTLMQ